MDNSKEQPMEVTTQDGASFTLTEEEAKFLKAVKRLGKLDQGRLLLFGSGLLDVRIQEQGKFTGQGYIIHSTSIRCEGGDGGDYF